MTHRVPLIVAFSLGAAALASGQQQQANDELVEEIYRPATVGEEGPGRYAFEPIDWRTARPLELDESWTSLPLPEDHVPMAVTYNAITGEETYEPAHLETGLQESWVSGSDYLGAIPEWEDSMGAPMPRSDHASFPWSTQCRLFFSQGGSNYVCSGTMIDPKFVVTAAHCVHEGPGGGWSTNMSVFPAWDGDDDAVGSSSAGPMTLYTTWINTGDLNYDIAWVELTRPVGFLTGWLGYGYNNDDDWFKSTTFNHAAYPGCNSGCFCNFSGCPNQLWYGWGAFDTVTTGRLYANMTGWCYTGGMSGGATYWLTGSNRYCYGVKSTRSYSGCTITGGTFTRIRGFMFDFMLNTLIPGGYSTSLDLIPMDVNAPSTVRAGALLGSLDYLIGNQSLANPATGTYYVDVYLSTNDNISGADYLLQRRSFVHDFGVKSSVRVSSTSGMPRIPDTFAPGTYWLGLILDLADSNTANNDTDGWDASEIQVLPRFSVLPSTFRWIPAGGITEDIDTLSGSHWISYRLNSDTLAYSSTAWANYGNQAPCIEAFRGADCLELGNDPLTTPVSPDNFSAFILAYNGQNGVNFVLDFMMKNFGEELDAPDGVWISANGNYWYSLTPGGWGALSPNWSVWESIRSIPVTGATPVNTDGNFFLAFIVQDNYAFGTADGIALDDIRLRASNVATLTVSKLRVGQNAQAHMSGGNPGDLAFFAASGNGPGPLFTSKGVILLTPPITYFKPFIVMNSAGEATYNVGPIPAGFTGAPVWWHAVKMPGWVFTNGLDTVIK